MTNTITDSSLKPCSGLRELNNMNEWMNECKLLVSLTKPCNSMNGSEDMCVWNVLPTLMCMETVKRCITS
jgi:hypothetical protein